MCTGVRWAGPRVSLLKQRISWHFHLTVSRARALFYTAASCEQGGAEGPQCTQGHLLSNSCVVFQNAQQQVNETSVPQIKKVEVTSALPTMTECRVDHQRTESCLWASHTWNPQLEIKPRMTQQGSPRHWCHIKARRPPPTPSIWCGDRR